MSDIIRQLPDSVANQIAAGEVVPRPAYVIKELVENAIDAGANEISIVVKDAGRTMIQVIDNGLGMSPTDARMAFERHATSKIQNAGDLFELHTMGFRGEALPSICAVSEVDVKTKTADSKLGTHLVISGSHVDLQEPYVCDKGTVMTVKKLFYNVPARRKFLKSDNVELTNIIREFERMALVNNNVKFHFEAGAKVIDLRAGSLKQRILDLWQNSLDAQLIPISVETSLVKIEGFVSRPEFARRRNALQFLIANGRNMKHLSFRRAILNCYDSLIAYDTQPCYFIKLSVDPNTIDVNISPTKNEINFEYEQEIWAIINASVKAALGKYSAVPSIDFTVDAIPVRPLRDGELPKEPKLDIPKSYNPFNSGKQTNYVNKNWDTLYQEFNKESEKKLNSHISQNKTDFSTDKVIVTSQPQNKGGLFEDEKDYEVGPICMQYDLKYIIMTSREGLILIDQHRAHVKVLYEEFIKDIDAMNVVSQNILFPEKITLDDAQINAYEEIEPELKRLGYSLEYDSGHDWLISAVPAMYKNLNATDTILKILDSVIEDSVNYGKDLDYKESLLSRCALLMARSAAIKGGTKLSSSEMESLTCKLFELEDPSLTPNGNKIYCLIDKNEIQKKFD